MKSEDLKKIQKPLKDLYLSNPKKAFIILKAYSKVGEESLTCSVDTGKAIVEAGLHPIAGGDGKSLCSGNMLLESLAACFGVTLRAVATAMDFNLQNGGITVEGDLDARGTLGVEKGVPVGFQKITVKLNLQTGEPQERINALLKLTERYCVIYQTLVHSPKVDNQVVLL